MNPGTLDSKGGDNQLVGEGGNANEVKSQPLSFTSTPEKC